VQGEVGEQRELELYRNTENHLIKAVDGNEKKQVLVPVMKGRPHGPYSRLFDDVNSRMWRTSPDLNSQFLLAVQQTMQNVLAARGHVFLNEVHDALGLERTSAGQIVGWVWDSPNGDNFIDFGIFEAHAEDFMAGREACVWLDFNVDGEIWKLLG
jgi:hypothetical protein